MLAKNLRVIRISKDLYDTMMIKMPKYNWPTRVSLVWDTSAIKLDNWLTKPAFRRKNR